MTNIENTPISYDLKSTSYESPLAVHMVHSAKSLSSLFTSEPQPEIGGSSIKLTGLVEDEKSREGFKWYEGFLVYNEQGEPKRLYSIEVPLVGLNGNKVRFSSQDFVPEHPEIMLFMGNTHEEKEAGLVQLIKNISALSFNDYELALLNKLGYSPFKTSEEDQYVASVIAPTNFFKNLPRETLDID